MLLSLIRFLKDKGPDLLSRLYSRDAIVMGVFRFLGNHEQQIILQCLSHNPARIHLERAKLDKSIKLLQSLGLLQVSENAIALSTAFKSTLVRVLSKGPAFPFSPKQDSRSGLDIETVPGEEDAFFQRWVEIYNYILRKVVIKNQGVAPDKKLRRVFANIIKSEGLKIRPEEFETDSERPERLKDEKKKLSGFGFLIQTIWAQVNLMLMYYYEYTIDRGRQTGANSSLSSKEKGFDADLLEFFFGMNFLDPHVFYAVNLQHTRIDKKDLESIMLDLDHLGLIELQSTSNPISGFRPTMLLTGFLTPDPARFERYKTNIIVENDFKIYAYSTLNYVQHFFSCLIRLVHRFEGQVSQYAYLLDQ